MRAAKDLVRLCILHGLAGAFAASIIIRQVSRVAAHICISAKSADLVQISNKQDLV